MVKKTKKYPLCAGFLKKYRFGALFLLFYLTCSNNMITRIRHIHGIAIVCGRNILTSPFGDLTMRYILIALELFIGFVLPVLLLPVALVLVAVFGLLALVVMEAESALRVPPSRVPPGVMRR